MLKAIRLLHDKMLHLTHRKGSRCRRWCAAVILMAVVALAASLATRYAFCRQTSASTVKTVQIQSSPAMSRQRLLKDAMVWTPPPVAAAALQAPGFYPRVSPAGPPLPGLLFEESLYNRPPPALSSLA